MAEEERGRPLPKFGEWDVNNPSTAEGFTVIFNKARHDKKTRGSAPAKITSPKTPHQTLQTTPHPPPHTPPKRKWFCCVQV